VDVLKLAHVEVDVGVPKSMALEQLVPCPHEKETKQVKNKI
jgi:hypothetical protein